MARAPDAAAGADAWTVERPEIPRRPGRRWESADTVVAIGVGLVVTVFAIFGYLCWQGYAQTQIQSQAKAQRAADSAALSVEWIIGSALAAATQVAYAAGDDVTRVPGPAADGFAEAARALPTPFQLGVFDVAGAPIPGSSRAGMPETLAGTDIFAELSGGRDWQVSAQMSDAAEGAPIFIVAKRVETSTGAFSGVVVISVRNAALEQIWSLQDLGANSTVSLVRDDGWVIGRYPPLPSALDLRGLPAFTALQAGETGTYQSSSSPADGLARIVGFHHVPGLGVIAVASIAREAAFAGLWVAIQTVLFLMVPIGLALLLGSFLTARLLRNAERTRNVLAAAVSHNEVLFREIHHRVKNNLQSVAALLQLQPIPREIKAEMGQRIAAMSAVHEHIYRSNNFTTVQVRDYLRTLIENLRAGGKPGTIVKEDIADLRVGRDHATPLGLILNEVVANAFKHAFADGRDGVVGVTLERDGAGMGRLTVEDNGVGFDPAAPSKGIGRRLIVALTEQLGGHSEFTGGETGARFTLTFPLAD